MAKPKQHRRRFDAAFKARVAFEAIKEQQTLAELAQRYGLHPNQISTWKKQMLDGGAAVFTTATGPAAGSIDEQTERKINELLRKIGQYQMELDWLKKKSGLDDIPQAGLGR